MPINYSKYSRGYDRELEEDEDKLDPRPHVERASNLELTQKVDHRDTVVKPYDKRDEREPNREKLREFHTPGEPNQDKLDDLQATMRPIRASQLSDINGEKDNGMG